MIRNYLKISIRRFKNRMLNSTINMLGLTLGLTSFILIILWVTEETSFDAFHEHKDNLYQLAILHPTGDVDPNVPYALPEVLSNEYKEIEAYTRIFRISTLSNNSIKYQKKDSSETIIFYEEKVVLVDSSFFNMFSFEFELGEKNIALSSPSSIVINSKMSKKYFGDQDPIGQVLTINNDQNFNVSGVVAIPNNTQFAYDFFIPIKFDLSTNWNWRDPSYLQVQKNIDLAYLKEKISTSLNKYHPGPLDGKFKVDLIPISKSYLSFGAMRYVHILSSIAIIILIVACVNYINLASIATNSRSREIGVQKVSGAKRHHLILQIISDAIIQCIIALSISLILVELVLPYYNKLVEKELSIGYFEDPKMLLFLILLTMLLGVFSGIFPGLVLTRSNPLATFNASQRIKSDRSLFRIFSVVGQFTVSMILIATTLLIFKQMNYVMQQPLGIKTEHILKIPMNRSLGMNYEAIRAELLSNTRIHSITLSQDAPINSDFKTGVDWENKDPGMVSNFRYSIASPGFIETFGIDVLEGRSYLNESRADLNNFLVNETAVKYMDMENPIGKEMTFWGQKGTIIGIYKDYHQVSLHREIMPQVIVSNPAFYRSLKYLFVKIEGSDIPSTLDFIREISQKFSPDYPFEFEFIDAEIEKLYLSDQRLGKIIAYFATLAIIISCLGIFGLAVYNIEQKTKEISIRKINGASVKNIMYLVNKNFMIWILVAFVIATPVTYFLLRLWLQSYSYKTPITWWIFGFSGMLALFISLVAISRLSVKAAMTNPVDNLRYE